MRTISIIVLFLFLSANSAIAYPAAKSTIRAVDEHGAVIDGAQVRISFSIPNESGIGLADINSNGSTDSNGILVVSGQTSGPVGFCIDKGGYYQSCSGYEFKTSTLSIRWEPWNPTIQVVLKKKRNPVPMFDSYRTGYKMPKFDTPIGFDLEKEDWVAPYGRGLVSDFNISFNAEIRAYTDYDCGFTLTFSNSNDGIQEYLFDNSNQSSFKWPFEAPERGYQHEVAKKKTMSPGNGYRSDEKKDVNYLFRVRTKVDHDGNIIAAKYGKLVGEFGFVPTGEITFRYILNPDGTRNLEDDPEKNLFKKK